MEKGLPPHSVHGMGDGEMLDQEIDTALFSNYSSWLGPMAYLELGYEPLWWVTYFLLLSRNPEFEIWKSSGNLSEERSYHAAGVVPVVVLESGCGR